VQRTASSTPWWTYSRPAASAADLLVSTHSTRVGRLPGTCVSIVSVLEPELVLQAPVRRGADIASASMASQDPIRRAQHTLNLTDLILPLEPDAPGADKVFRAPPRILLVPELAAFFRVLDVDGRVYLFRRLDGGVLGLAEWLILEELRALGGALRVLTAHGPSPCVPSRHTKLSLRSICHTILCAGHRGGRTFDVQGIT